VPLLGSGCKRGGTGCYDAFMFKLSFPRSQFISPTDPVLRIESAMDCDGSECGSAVFEPDGTPVDLPPHFHVVESQNGAWTRSYAIGGALPDNQFEGSHWS